MDKVIFCMECGRPWGVILGRGELPTEETQRLAQGALEKALVELFKEWGGEVRVDNLEVDVKAEPEEVVFVTEALASFASEHCGSEMIGEVPAWYVIDDIDIPDWLLKQRSRRWAYKWDCCGIDPDRLLAEAPSS